MSVAQFTCLMMAFYALISEKGTCFRAMFFGTSVVILLEVIFLRI